MIKTDQQLERTRKSIEEFKTQLKHMQTLEDELERQLASASYQGMISMLELEIERYENAKKGIVQIPRTITSISDLCPYITDIRIALGWTQDTLAMRLGVTRQRINQMEEHEYRGISVVQLQEILEALGLMTETAVRHNTVQLVSEYSGEIGRHMAAAV